MKPVIKKNILVLEDELPLSRVIGTKLKKEGFDVVIGKTVEQGLDYLKEGVEIHCVWLDHYLLSNKSGLDFIATLKHSKEWNDIPVFVITNTGGEEKRHTYLKLGAVKYYIKADCRLDAIVKDIKEFLASGEIKK